MSEQIKRVAIYGRISTEGQSVGMQLAELNDFIARRGWQLVVGHQRQDYSKGRSGA
jgi:DNA invertase Pin-like site-specific DNA recombinase